MARVYKRHDRKGQWALDYVDASGKRVRVLTEAQTKREANALLSARQTENNRARYLGLGNANALSMTLGQFIKDIYFPGLGELRPRTVERYKSLAATLPQRLLDTPLQLVRRNTVRSYLEDRRKNGKSRSSGKALSVATVNRELALIRQVLNDALDREYIMATPCARMKSEPEHNIRDRVMDELEEVRLLTKASEWLGEIIRVAVWSGLRQGEILVLRWEDVNKRGWNLRVTAKVAKNHQVAYVPIAEPIREIFNRDRFTGKNGPSPWVFTDPATGEPYRKQKVQDHYKRALHRANIKDLTFHDLRRTFASRLTNLGVSLPIIASLLRQNSAYVTTRYAHASDTAREAAIAKLANSSRAEQSQEVAEAK